MITQDLGIRELDDNEFIRSTRVIRDSFKTVTAQFGLTKNNSASHPSFMTVRQLYKLKDQGVKLFGLFLGNRQVGFVAVEEALEKCQRFEHMQERFKNSLLLRIKREFSDLDDKQALLVSGDIESSLAQYFIEGGLSLSSLLFSRGTLRTAPGLLLPFITAASTRYDNLTMRHAFFKASVDAFVHPESAEIDYYRLFRKDITRILCISWIGSIW